MRLLLVTRATMADHSRLVLPVLLAVVFLRGPLPTVRAAFTTTGNVEPANPATWTSSTIGYIGKTADGTVTVDSDSNLLSGPSYIGYNGGAKGQVTVTGSGSRWINSGSLGVGYWPGGTGTLSITAGGAVSNTWGCIGYDSGWDNRVTVDGSGSVWTNSGTLYVGGYYSDSKGTLSITNGGNVSNDYGYVGFNSRSTGLVTVDGIGSTWTNNGRLYVGCSLDGSSGTLSIKNAGVVSSGSIGYSSVGDVYGSTGVVTVNGNDSKWTIDNDLHVGNGGNGTLAITGGGAVRNESANISAISGGSGAKGVVTVSDTGSAWTNTGYIYVGGAGNGILSITDGGDVSSTYGAIGYNSGSTGAVTVTGTDSTWTNTSGCIYVGYGGGGGLSITNGGSLSSYGGYIAYSFGSTGTMTVDGASSAWTSSSGGLTVGQSGSGMLSITNGSSVSIAGETWVGRYAGSTGSIKFGTNGGTLTTRSLLASPTQLAGTGTINTYGLVSDVNLTFASADDLQRTLTFQQAGQNVTVNLDMTGGTSTNGAVGAGWKGTGSLRIQDGITVTATSGYIGYHSGSTGTATVDGTGSTWINSGSLGVGCYGNGTFSVKNGGTVSTADGGIGSQSGSVGTVTVDGGDSTWTNSGSLVVGSSGRAALSITNGGRVSNTIGYIGNASTSNTVTVNGAGSNWANSGNLYVGRYGGGGTISIAGGGGVSNNYGYIGYYSGSTGTATLEDASSSWTNNSRLYVGYAGTGTVTQASGITTITGALYLGGDTSGQGTYTLNGGVVALQALSKGSGTATFNFGGGTLRAIAAFSSSLPITLTGTGGNATVDTQSNAVTLSGVLSGTGGLDKLGAGTLTLSGNNNYSGDTRISGGSLALANTNALIGSTLNYNTYGGTLSFGSTSAATLGGLKGGQNLPLGSVAVTVGANNADTLYSGVLSGDGSLTKTGSGNLSLSGANTYTGATTVSAGVLNIQNSQATGTTAGGVSVASSAALELQHTVGINIGFEALSLTGTGIGGNGALRNIAGSNTWTGTITLTDATTIQSDAGSLTLSAANAVTGTNRDLTLQGLSNGTISGSIATGTGKLIKNGTGAWTLSGTNSYTGGTTINAGLLNVTSTLVSNGSDKVSICAGATGATKLTRHVLGTGLPSYVGLGSTVVSGELNSKADIVAGVAGGAADVGMAWRTRTNEEKTQCGGGLISEILSLDGIHANSGRTDNFLLQVSYDTTALSSIWGLTEAEAITQHRLYLGTLDGSTWIVAVMHNTGGTPSWKGDMLVSSVATGDLAAELGWYGVDTTTHVAWAVLDHNSQFAVAPQPDSDEDGVADCRDNCPSTVYGIEVDAEGCPPIIPGDFDRDGDADNDDLTKFIDCATGPGILYTGGNIPATCTLSLEPVGLLKPDIDGDGDIDADDFGILQRCLSEDQPADPNCGG